MSAAPLSRRACLALALLPATTAAEPPPPGRFVPDTDPDRIPWHQLDKLHGPTPPARGKRFGVVLKTMSNEYWRQMAAGYRRRAAEDGVKLDIQAASSESDSLRQLAMMQDMIGSQYAGILVSPQSDSNLQPAIDDAVRASIPVVDVDGAVVDSVQHFVGAVNREMGVRVARWFLDHLPAGRKVAVIEGLPGVFSSVHRTAGFRDTLLASKRLEIVASASGRWERGVAHGLALEILRKSPSLVGFYCNNDTMALGVVDAVKSLGLLRQVRIIGNDGTGEAYRSIRAGELTGTVDIFPTLAAETGLDVIERLVAGQRIPRVIETPQVLVTADNLDRYSGSPEQVRRVLR